MTKSKKIVSLLLLLAMVVSLFGAMAMTASASPGTASTCSIPVTKTFLGEDSIVSALRGTYTFTVTPGAAIPASKILAGPAITSGGTLTLTKNSSSSTLTGNIQWGFDLGTAPGIYHYVIKETPGNDGTGNTNLIAYDKSEYDVFVQVGYDQNEQLVVIGTYVYKAKDKNGNTVSYTYGVTSKSDVAFENAVKSDEVYVTKIVTGNMGDQNKSFNFTATIAPTTTEASTYIPVANLSWTCKIYNVETNEVVSTSTGTGGTINFALKHNQQAWISSIPVGYTVTVTEADYSSDGYTTTISDDDSDIEATVNGKTASAVMEGDALNFDICYTNRNEQTITGVFMSYAPYIAVLLAVFGLGIAYVVMKKRAQIDG